VRWDNLFDDLEGQLEDELNAEDSELRVEEERLRLGRLSLRSRLVALSRTGPAGGSGVLRVVLGSGAWLTLRPTTFGRDWLAADLLGTEPRGTEQAGPGRLGTLASGRGASPQCVIPLAAIAGVVMHPGEVQGSLDNEPEPAPRLVDRIGLPFVLRDLSRRRRTVDVYTRGSSAGGALTGTIDQVGRDHLDLAVHEPGVPRRASEVRQYRIVPLTEIQMLCCR
jgi:hypothetical protein